MKYIFRSCIGALILFFSIQLSAFPISYTRLVHPETGQCIDLIGDMHVKLSEQDLNFTDSEQLKKCSDYEETLLQSLKKLDEQSTKPINFVWEMHNDWSQGKYPQFLFRAFKDMQQNKTKRANLICGDFLSLAIHILNELFTSFRNQIKSADTGAEYSYLSVQQYIEWIQNRYKFKGSLTIKDFLNSFSKMDDLIEKVKSAHPVLYDQIKGEWLMLKNGLLPNLVDYFYLEKYKELSLIEYGNKVQEITLNKIKTDRSHPLFYLELTGFDILVSFYRNIGFLAHTLSSQNHTVVYAGNAHIQFLNANLQRFGFIQYFNRRPHKKIGVDHLLSETHPMLYAWDPINGLLDDQEAYNKRGEIHDFVIKKNILRVPWDSNIWNKVLLEDPAIAHAIIKKKQGKTEEPS